MLFISHNLAVVRYIADVIAVMYCGRLFEVGVTDDVVGRPQHPYTAALLVAAPRLDAGNRVDSGLVSGDPADPHHPPAGCRFHPRCAFGPARRAEHAICAEQDPGADAQTRAHRAACFFPGMPSEVSR